MMLYKPVFLALHLCMLSTATAHSRDHIEEHQTSTPAYIGPTFNPTEALNYASTGSLDYHLTTTTAKGSSTSDFTTSVVSPESTTASTPRTSATTSQGDGRPSPALESFPSTSKSAAAPAGYGSGFTCGRYIVAMAGLIGGFA